MAVQWTALPPVEINTASSSHGPSDSFAHPEWFNTSCLADAISTGPDLSTDGWIISRSTLEAPPTLRNTPAVFAQGTSFEPATATEVLNPCQSVGTTTYQHALSIAIEFDYASGLPFEHPLSFDSDAAESSSTTNSPIPSPDNNYPMSYELDDEQRTVLGKGNCTREIQLSIKRASLGDAVEAELEPKRARKRGPPRRQPTSSSTGASIGRRQPHNEVERKYRESINAGLELLQRTVPTLPPGNSRDLLVTPKPTKATVLASAVDYIKHIEAQRDRLVNENEQLRRSGLYTVGGEGHAIFKTKPGQRQI